MAGNLNVLKKDLHKLADKKKAEFFPRFFKSGPGQYAQGDKFIGVTVPNSRLIATKYKDLTLDEIEKLLDSPIHEERLIALLILVYQFEKGSEELKKTIYSFYLKHTKQINNWDLVDLSAGKIVGEYLLKKDRRILYQLAKSKDLWEKRIAIVATSTFIKNHEFNDTLAISKILLLDERVLSSGETLGNKHDLIHKAVGWMLREVGHKDEALLINFLKGNYPNIPRTSLRYAIEIFPEEIRKKYLKRMFAN